MDADVLLLYLMTFAAVRDVVIKSADARLDVNVALGRPTYQSSNYQNRLTSLANDGSLSTSILLCAHTNAELNPWWVVDLGVQLYVAGIKYTSRDDESGL